MTLIDLFSTSPAWLITSIALLSLLIGSFLNVVIHRLPIMLDREWRKQSSELLATAPVGAVGVGSTSEAVGLKSDLQNQASEPTAHRLQPTAPYNLIVPRSACPKCNAPITALQNIPVLSWL